MADRYWVGGSGSWSDATNHWSDSSGGSPGAGFLPTSADDVFFDANSNVGTGTFTVTVDGTSVSPSLCKSFATGGAGGALDGAMTLSLSATAFIDIYGSLTLPATNFTWSGTTGARVTFRSTAAGNTITTNGVSLTNTRPQIDGVGGDWTLGSALTFGTGSTFGLANGTFSTANYNMTGGALESIGTGTRSLSLGSSTLTLAAVAVVTLSGSNLTFNAGTSTISCSAAGPTLAGGGYTFYTVNFTSTSGNNTSTVTGANTFTNLSQTTPASLIRRIVFGDNQTISGTLTLGASNTAVRRVTCRSSVVGTQRTLTVATLATLADVDFQDINAAGSSAASPWSGTRIGNCGGNSNITFTAASDKYWYSATGAGGNWSAAQWETTAGGTTPSVNNFPLAQDTVKFQNTGLNTGNTLTIDTTWNLPAIDGTARTNAMTLASGTQTLTIFGDLTIVSAMTITGTGSWRFSKQGTQNVTTNGVTVTWPVNVENGTGSVKLIDNWTVSNTGTLTTGGLNLNDKILTCTTFSSSNTNTRSIAFGTGKIAVTANNATIIIMGDLTNFSYTGTPLIDCTYSGSANARSIDCGRNFRLETNVPSVKISAGSDTVSVITSGYFKDLDFSGFSGICTGPSRFIYGNLTLSPTMTWSSTSGFLYFAATSGTQKITTSGVTINQEVRFDSVLAELQDSITIGAYAFRALTGVIRLKAGTTNTAGTWSLFTAGPTFYFTLETTVPGTQATIVQTSGTVNAKNMTVKDIVATGGATFNAFTGSGSTTSNNNVNSGNNLGWYFMPPGATFMDFF